MTCSAKAEKPLRLRRTPRTGVGPGTNCARQVAETCGTGTKGKDVETICGLRPWERSEPDPTWPAAVELDDAREVVVTRLAVESEAVRASTRVLSDDERRRASRFVFDRDARRYIVARARLRQLLAARLGAPPESLEFAYGAHGKPALAQRFAGSGLCFNVSHCDDVAVFALSNGPAIGVDVEAIRVMSDADAIAARLFTRRENQAYRALDWRDKPLGFFNCWTRKEAFVKALGEGLSHRLDRFEVSLAPGEPARILRVEDAPGDDCGWSLDSFSPAPGYVAAIAGQR
jgi:4'-phosphopantetheinyl transferase